MGKTGVTVSTQIKSANTESEKKFHSGKENRGKIKHENTNINKHLSHKNVELVFHDKRELLHKHYDERIEKHNKHNNSEARRWDLDKFLNTFEGKEIKSKGKSTGNYRWATASQLSYFGSDELLNPILKFLNDSGVSKDVIRDTYVKGYEAYVKEHNYSFPTLPICESNIHFDEVTPHGHDDIVVMGHTQKGQASESINNALGEKYGYAKTYSERVGNMAKYREENDEIIFRNIGSELENLAKEYGIPLDFEMIRTGEEGFSTSKEYKTNQDLENLREHLEEEKEKLNEKESDLKDYEISLNARSRGLDVRESKSADYINKLFEEKEKEFENNIIDIEVKELEKSEEFYKELAEKIREEEEIIRKRQEIEEKQKNESIRLKELNEKINNKANLFTAITLAVLENDPNNTKNYEHIKEKGVLNVKDDVLINVLDKSLDRQYKRGQISQIHQEIEDGGPDL